MILSKKFCLKHQNKVILVLRLLNLRTWMTLKTSVVILQALETSAASLTSVASATSLASTALFPQKTSGYWWSDHHWHKMTNTGHFLWNGSSKTQFFTNIWYPFWKRLLRLVCFTFLKTGWWNSNAQNLRNTQIEIPSFWSKSGF